jgi:hypothetical protein
MILTSLAKFPRPSQRLYHDEVKHAQVEDLRSKVHTFQTGSLDGSKILNRRHGTDERLSRAESRIEHIQSHGGPGNAQMGINGLFDILEKVVAKKNDEDEEDYWEDWGDEEEDEDEEF